MRQLIKGKKRMIVDTRCDSASSQADYVQDRDGASALLATTSLGQRVVSTFFGAQNCSSQPLITYRG